MAHRTLKYRAFFTTATASLLVLLLLPLVAGDVRSSPIGPRPVRTVMDLMEVMLNQDILGMLQNGGFDFRQPARIFLPPKFYSVVPLDQGHMSPEEILRLTATPVDLSAVSIGGKAAHQRPSAADGSRINLISYSTGKATTTTAEGRPTVANKGSETLEKNVGTNVNANGAALSGTGSSSSSSSSSNTRSRSGSDTASAANEQQPALTTSITDQTVSQNVGRTLPTSGPSGSTTDRLRLALPGEPDVDYPILGSVPTTQFSCEKRHHGYYADVETRCQVFRVCANTDSTGRGFAFLCPNGTLFNQRHLVCDWYMNVRCEESENYYRVNEDIGRMAGGRSVVGENRRDMMQIVMSMVMHPMRTLMQAMQGGAGERALSVGEVQPVKNSLSGGATNGVFPTPGTGLEPPYDRERSQPEGVNGNAPTGSSYVTQPEVNAVVQPPSNAVYTPNLNEVYVSNLGTLSTDPDSGFDPVRSTLLTRTGASAVLESQDQKYEVFRQPQKQLSTLPKLGGPGIQLITADLVKSWNGQASFPSQPPTSTRITSSVSQQQARPPSPPSAVAFRQGSILPPTGVLPPSSLTRTVSIGSAGPSIGSPATHRFAPVHRVLPIQKVTVVPERSYQQPGNFEYPRQTTAPVAISNAPRVEVYESLRTSRVEATDSTPAQGVPQMSYITPGNFPPKARFSYATPAHVPARPFQQYVQQPARSAQQVYAVSPANYWQGGRSSLPTASQPVPFLRRNDGPLRTDYQAATSPGRVKTTTVLQVVPSLSFYLNDAKEKRAFDEAIRQGLFDDRRRRTFSSYDVPLGSVGRLGNTFPTRVKGCRT
ncbi:uncharacterized protein LOC128724744 [Anopheles nili]|uniref:uncharacterized protein LOC128724744 n=1 Tax=Anopheles nili TaxID=185578 RepID=UPI00237AF3AD|nr:uncharacterized protein LOC128724744 [Anopheles nili]